MENMDYTMCEVRDTLPAMVSGIWSTEGDMQLAMARQFRKLLSIAGNPHIEEVIQSGVVPRLVEFLATDSFPELQFEAAWALGNIASGTSENTRAVVDYGAVPVFVMLLNSPSNDVRERAAGALGNIACDPKCHDIVLSHGALTPLLALLNDNTNPAILREATWTLAAILCRGSPQLVFEQVKPALPALKHLLHSNYVMVLANVCLALSALSYGYKHDKIQALIDADVCKRLVELLHRTTSSEVLIPALKTVGSICGGDDLQTQCIINHGALPRLLSLLSTHHLETSIKKECCFVISIITAGNRDQLQAVIEAGLIGPLVNLVQTAEFDVKKEVAWAYFKCRVHGNQRANHNCIKPLCDALVFPDEEVVIECLAGLENILRVGQEVNHFAKLIDEADGSEKIKNLRTHNNNEIRAKAARILRAYWRGSNVALPSGEEAQLGFNFGSMVIQPGR